MECKHERTKENYSHGKKSDSDKYCKDCGMPLTKLEIRRKKKKERQEKNKWRY